LDDDRNFYRLFQTKKNMITKKPTLISSFALIDAILLSIILVVALSFRLYKVNIPLADYHSWRQVDTAAVARNFVRDGFNLMSPRYDDLSAIESGIENPNGYRFVEFPIYNAIFAFFYKAYPGISIEAWGRITTALFSLITIAVLYYLCFKEVNRFTAVVTSGIYAVFPFFVYFSRVILPETPALSLVMLSIFFLYKGTHRSIKESYSLIHVLFSAIFFALATLVKPTVIFYSLTLGFIFLSKEHFQIIKSWRFYLYFIIVFIPLLLWRNYIKAFPEGIPANSWLIAYVNTYKGQENIFFRPAFFRWIFFERIGQNMLGVYLSFFVLLGFFIKSKKYILHSVLISGLVYLFTFQGGNVQHEYYQTLILPGIAIMIGLGINSLFTNTKTFINPFLCVILIIFILAFAWFFSFYKVRDFYYYPPELPQIAKIIRTLTPPNAKIVTDRMGDTTLLYLIDRKGSPGLNKGLKELKNMGYQYFVTLNSETIANTKKTELYKTVFENAQFTLFSL